MLNEFPTLWGRQYVKTTSTQPRCTTTCLTLYCSYIVLNPKRNGGASWDRAKRDMYRFDGLSFAFSKSCLEPDPLSSRWSHLWASPHLEVNADGGEASEGELGHIGAALERRRVELHAEVGLRDGRRGTRDRSRLERWRVKRLWIDAHSVGNSDGTASKAKWSVVSQDGKQQRVSYRTYSKSLWFT